MKKIERLYEIVRRLNNEAFECVREAEGRVHDLDRAEANGMLVAYSTALTLIEALYDMEPADAEPCGRSDK